MNSSTTKQKLVIVLQGVYNSGKTTTLNYLIQLLQEPETPWDLALDRRVLIPYQGKKVYVATPGDLKFEIWKSIALSEIEECDILVTAARSRGETLEPIEEYTKKINAAHVEIQKRRVKEGRDEANRAQAQDIKDIRDGVNRRDAQSLKDRIDAFIKEHL